MRYFVSLLIVAFSSLAYAAAPSLDGSWRFAGSERELEQMHDAVDVSVESMNFMMRPIAKRVLRKECKPWNSVAIDLEGQSVTVTYDGDPLAAPLNRTITVKTKKGEPMKVLREMRGAALYEKLWTKDGGRKNTYRRTSNGVVVQSEIFSDRLPVPARFTYTYR